jgi:outer membrane protein assembly factor BamA
VLPKLLKPVVVILLFFHVSGIFAQYQDTLFTVDSIVIIGNKRTRSSIISRELTFSKGDTIQNWQYQKEQSRRQLINLFLFNEILISRSAGMVTVQVTERWYIWPYPELGYADRNLSQWLLSGDPRRLIYGLKLQWYNIRGRNETMQLDLITGYTKMVNFGYKIPYFNRRQTWGAQVFATYSSNREVWYKTEQDKVRFFKDNDRNLIYRKGIELSAVHRKRIFSYHQIYAGFLQTEIADTVYAQDVNSQFFLDRNKKQQEVYAGYNYTFDKRDFKGFPLNGYLLKTGAEFGRLSSGALQKNTLTLKASFSRYFRIAGSFFGSVNGTARYYSLENPPYTKIRALGYGKDYIRGYELKVIDGNHFVLGKAEIKYRFLNRKYKFLPRVNNYAVLPLALYVSTYTDAGYVHKTAGVLNAGDNNILPNSWQHGTGIGLNVVAFYDYCFRAEYSFDKYLNNRMYFSFVASM